MRHPSIRPMRSPGPTIAKRTPERIGQTARTSRKSSAKKMRLICRGRISRRPAAEPQAYSAVQKSEAAGEDHRLTAPAMHFRQICSVRTHIRLEVASPGGESTGYASLTFVSRPGSAPHSANAYLAQPTQQQYRVGLSSGG